MNYFQSFLKQRLTSFVVNLYGLQIKQSEGLAPIWNTGQYYLGGKTPLHSLSLSNCLILTVALLIFIFLEGFSLLFIIDLRARAIGLYSRRKTGRRIRGKQGNSMDYFPLIYSWFCQELDSIVPIQGAYPWFLCRNGTSNDTRQIQGCPDSDSLVIHTRANAISLNLLLINGDGIPMPISDEATFEARPSAFVDYFLNKACHLDFH